MINFFKQIINKIMFTFKLKTISKRLETLERMNHTMTMHEKLFELSCVNDDLTYLMNKYKINDVELEYSSQMFNKNMRQGKV